MQEVVPAQAGRGPDRPAAEPLRPAVRAGQLRSLVVLRPQLRPAAVDVAGDYLRAPSLEGALASGTEPASGCTSG